MKQYLFITTIVAGLLLTSCSNDDDHNPRYDFFYDEITSAIVSDTMTIGNTYTINFTVELENSCQDLVDFSYSRIGDERYITAISTEYINNSSCNEIISLDNLDFRFTPTQETTYTFKFWQGQDIDGKDIYEEHSVVAVP